VCDLLSITSEPLTQRANMLSEAGIVARRHSADLPQPRSTESPDMRGYRGHWIHRLLSGCTVAHRVDSRSCSLGLMTHHSYLTLHTMNMLNAFKGKVVRGRGGNT
jgi:hypothetical protein